MKTPTRPLLRAVAGTLVVAGALAGCGPNAILGSGDANTNDTTPTDTAGDTVTDTRTDVPTDAPADNRPDVPEDVPVDAPVDTPDEDATPPMDAEDVPTPPDGGDVVTPPADGDDVVSPPDGGDVVTPPVDADDAATPPDAPADAPIEIAVGDVTCATGQTLCGGVCTVTATDNANCGACGTVCAGGRTCTAGTCGCPMGTMACGDRCIDVTSDTANCGMCGMACAAGQACNAGVCGCATGSMMCGGSCANTQTDPANCGACGTVCGAGQACNAGVCACAAGSLSCGATGAPLVCVNPASDNANCGMCGNACPTGRSCVMGACACPTGQTSCGMGATATCSDTMTDNNNCGACGTVCSGGATCTGGACVCPTGQTRCGTGATATCTDTQTDSANCGVCGTTCPTGQVCTMGMCRSTCTLPNVPCVAGGVTTCANTQNDDQNCGACGTVCGTVPNSFGGLCTTGTCRPICTAGFANCDNMYANGCEVNTTNNATNCGACGMRCPDSLPQSSSVVCQNSVCRGVCNTGRGDCDADRTNGCETDTTTSLANCGGCGTACPAAAVACINSVCVVATPIDVTTGTTVINTVATPITASMNGATTVTVMSATGLLVGQKVLLHQSAGTNAGTYETGRILGIAGTVVTLDNPTDRAYAPGSQLVVIREATTVNVAAGATLTAPAWNGSTGGILAIEATGAVTVAGSIDMVGRGFRGGNSNITCATAAAGRQCIVGVQGESPAGIGTRTVMRNTSGGGGGQQGQDCGMGSGGAYGAVGTDGPIPTGACRVNAPSQGGAVVGSAMLMGTNAVLLFGGGGGEGGGDEDGFRPGVGGAGGGVVFITAPSITVPNTGAISANGGTGEAGIQVATCGGSNTGGGCGMSGGGGGGGGGIALNVTTLTLAAGGTGNRVSAVGGTGGRDTVGGVAIPCGGNCGTIPGGAGRTAIRTTTVVTAGGGTASPAFATN